MILFLERGGGREKKRERNINVWVPLTCPGPQQACNPGTCPDWELNWWPFGSQAGVQYTEPHQPGVFCFVLKAGNAFYTIVIFLSYKKQVRSGGHGPFLNGQRHSLHPHGCATITTVRVQNCCIVRAGTLSPFNTDSHLSLASARWPPFYLPIFTYSTLLGTLDKWDRMMFALSCLRHFIQRDALKLHPRCSSMGQNFISFLRLNHIPLCVFCLSIYPLMDIWVVSTFWLLWMICCHHWYIRTGYLLLCFAVIFVVALHAFQEVWDAYLTTFDYSRSFLEATF